MKEKKGENLLGRSYLAVALFAVLPHEVHSMAVLVPEGALVGEGAVCDGDVIVVVIGGEGSTLVVGHGVTWRGDWGSEGAWQESHFTRSVYWLRVWADVTFKATFPAGKQYHY